MPSPKGFKMLAANQDTLPPAWYDERAFAIPSPEIIFAVNAAKRRRAEEARQEIPVWDDDGGAQLGMNRAHPGSRIVPLMQVFR